MQQSSQAVSQAPRGDGLEDARTRHFAIINSLFSFFSYTLECPWTCPAIDRPTTLVSPQGVASCP